MDLHDDQRRLREAIAENKVLRHLCERHGIDWQAHLRNQSTLEVRFAHIAEQVCALWPKPAAADYLHSLIFEQRPGAKGFPTDALDELLTLQALLASLGVRPAAHAAHPAAREDVWKHSEGTGDTTLRGGRAPAPERPGGSPYDYTGPRRRGL